MRLYAMLIAVLVSTFACAQTRWEFAELRINALRSSSTTLFTYEFEDNFRNSVAPNWEMFSRDTGIPVNDGDYWDVLSELGQEGWELVNFDTEAFINPEGIENTTRTWYFKRSLSSP